MAKPPPDTARRSATPTLWVAVIAALIAAVGVFISGMQTYLTRQNNIVSQRAFVFVGPPSAGPGIEEDKITKSVAFAIPLINSGNTATKDLKLFVRCAKSVDPTPEPWVLLNQDKPSIQDVIGPRATGTSVCGFNADDFQQIAKGKLLGYLLVNITYRNRLDDGPLHKTQSARQIIYVQYGPNEEIVSVALQPRGRHNYADDECPP